MNREQHEWIRANVKGVLASDLVRMFNERFGESWSVNQARAYKKNHKLKSGIDCRYPKGSVPANKGKKVPKHKQSIATQFKKGKMPHNHLPIGSEVLSTDGYLRTKVAEPNKWKFTHKLIYQEHNGKIPEGYVVIFTDGNHLNVNIDNLVAVPRMVLLTMNRKGLFKEDTDLTKTGIKIAKVINRTYEIEKEIKVNK
ncbi:HNH endonuclease [Clostridia bacterium]|nr:HNH endonuclease [Clostridia bacterium]